MPPVHSGLLAPGTNQVGLNTGGFRHRTYGRPVQIKLGIDLPVRKIGDYLKHWGMTPQKPARQANEQSPKAVQQWLGQDYLEIKVQVNRESAEIYWDDETGIRNDSQHEGSYAPKGKTPAVRLNANRTSTSMISAITNQGKVRFRVFDGTMNADTLIDFCKRLTEASGRKVYLILDNLRVHHAWLFKAWPKKHEGPSYR